MNRMLRLIGLSATAVIIGACSASEPAPIFPQLRFANLEPVAIGALSSEVIDRTVPSRLPGNVEHLAPVSFRDAVVSWSRARFLPNGVGSIRFVTDIEEASIQQRSLAIDGGIRGALKKEQATEYETRISVVVRAINTSGVPVAEARATAWQTRTLPEGAGTTDVQTLLFEMVEATVVAMDAQMLAEIPNHFSAYIL